ncbi:hypothetical protein V6N13_030556 [Hibiscus sabdariffa]
MCKCRSHGTFPLFGLQSSHLNICYYHQDLHRRPLRPGSRPSFYGDRHALLLIGAWPLPRRPGIGHTLKRHPFSGLVDSADGPDGEPAGRRPEHAGAEARRDGACWVPRSRRRRLHGRIEGPGLGRHHNPRRSTPRADRRTGSRRSTSDRGTSPAPIRFPPDNFKHSLTLFSKSFSSFPRGTCSLSVSRPYLALDGIYRPIRAAFPNNPTRRQRLVVRQGPGTTGLTPSPVPLSRGLGPGPPLRTLLQTTIRTQRATDSQAGLFPVRSPLLRESFGHVSAAHAPRTGVQQQTATFSFRFLGVIHAGGCSFCHGVTGSRVTGTGRGRGAMKRPHPLPLMFDNTFTGRSARQVQWISRDVAGSEPPTSPRSEHITGPFNRAGGTTRPIKARSASPAVGMSRPVLTVRRTGRPTPRSNYELFNCNNLNIRYWSWNYRGCWINQVAFLRDVRPACSSTHYLGRGEAITGQDHRSCQGTKCTSYERPGPRPYAHEIYRIQKHDRASMHRRGRIMPIDTLGTPSTTEVHQAATRSLDEKGMTIHPKFHQFRYATQDPYRTHWARRPQGEDIKEECGSTVRCMKHGACRRTQPFHHSHAHCVLVAASTPTGPQPTRAKDSIEERRKQ